MTSLPNEFLDLLRPQLGASFDRFMHSLGESPPVSIRLHPLKNATIPFESPVPWTQFGKYLSSRPSFTLDPLFHAGTYYVQEASSMFLEQALTQTVNLRQPLKILDLCAAPGGKSTHVLSLVSRESLLVSNEAIRSRAVILSENIQKWGYPNAVVTNNDPADFKKLPGFFDVIVIDAPCSGEGLFRKEPEAIQEWSPENVQRCAARQKRIVSDALDALKEGGVLIYCTCTYNTFENEENLRWMSDTHQLEFLKLSTDPSWGIVEVHEGPVKGYRFYPHNLRGEGFFLSAMRKNSPSDPVRMKSRKSIPAPPAKSQERFRDWLKHKDDYRFFLFNDLVFCTPAAVSDALEAVLQSTRIVYAGTNVATIKHDKLVPEHALALSVDVNPDSVPLLDVDESTALSYLRRDQVLLAYPRTGFVLLSFKGIPIGWVNVLANRVNNMYPSHWRVRK